jgi:hypothetical protein
MSAKPFLINSITVPIIGSTYLDATGPHLTPLPALIADLKAAGANDVKLVVTAGVAANLGDNAYDAGLLAALKPSDAKLLDFAAQLRAEGLSLTWSPFFALANTIAGSSSAGQGDRIRPSDFDTWIANHKVSLVQQAQLAQTAGAQRFVLVSDELQQMLFETSRTDSAKIAKWMDLIQSVRAVFKGEITSTIAMDGTRFGGGVTHLGLIPEQIVAAWDSIGIGLFPDPLTTKSDPSLAELTAAWSSNANGFNSIATLRGYAEQFGKKVWISDRAAHSFDGSNMNHAQVLQSQPALTVDQQEQADVLDSLLRAFSLEEGSWFTGVAIQNMNRLADYTSGVARFLDSSVGENIQGKLAQGVVAAWFNGLRQGTGVTREGSAAGDRLEGGYHHDTLAGRSGDDTLIGGAGKDTAVYSGRHADFRITRTGGNMTVSDTTGAEGSDTLVDVERLRFADKLVALDTAGNAGMAYRLYQAAFDRKPDESGLGYQMNALDGGLGLSQVAANFIASPEFQATYGALDNTLFVTQLYRNVLHRAPDAGGLQFHVDNLGRGLARAEVLVGFSESPENQAALIGTIQNGMVYTL